ncbi:AAA family ATPase [Pedobacter sp. HMF7647]|uniref:AAA family ATPase n=1 Tax=Hufsiella arboris TaxID=2695275 RepID=A0A7K1YDJ7_9SPHI|nr:AAA family ATPase [Hufsiella arboris]
MSEISRYKFLFAGSVIVCLFAAFIYREIEFSEKTTIDLPQFVSAEASNDSSVLIRHSISVLRKRAGRLDSIKSDQDAGPYSLEKATARYTKELDVLNAIKPYITGPPDQFIQIPDSFELTDSTLRNTIRELNQAQIRRQTLLSKQSPEDKRRSATASKNISALTKRVSGIISIRQTDVETILNSLRNTSKSGLSKIDVELSAINALIRQHENLTPEIPQTSQSAQASLTSKNSSAVPLYIGAALLGLLLPLPYILLAAGKTDLIRHLADIKKITAIPLLTPAEVIYDQRQFTLEQFTFAPLIKRLNPVISFFETLPAEKGKIISLTCSNAREGRTFFTIKLAVALSLLNKKVVLVDLDLQNAFLTKDFQLQKLSGVSDFLAGGTNDGPALLTTSKISPNLNLLGLGSPDNLKQVTELLNSDPPAGQVTDAGHSVLHSRFEQLLFQLKNLCDYLIINCPPVSPDIDIYPILRQADSNIFVARYGYSSKNKLNWFNELNLNNLLKRPLVVVNNMAQLDFMPGFLDVLND